MRHPKTVAILEVMWDWKQKTSAANPNYLAQAPRCFHISPENHSGRVLYKLLGHDNLLVTNACPQLVTSPKGKGNPDAQWLADSLNEITFSVLLVCGKVAQETYDRVGSVPGDYRTIYLPHPAARQWTKRDMVLASGMVQEGKADLHLQFRRGRLRAKQLIPF